MALGVSSCIAILRCCRLTKKRHLSGTSDITWPITYHVSLYAVAVMARPRSIVWFFMKYCLRLEKIAPLETNMSLATRASEITTNSWLPIQREKIGPYVLDQARRARSG